MEIKKVRVDLSGSANDKSYDILIGPGIISGVGGPAGVGQAVAPGFFDSGVGGRIKKRGRVFVITCETVNKLHFSSLERFFGGAGINPVAFILPDGESTKSLKYISLLYDELIKNRAERADYIAAFGGGVIGDAAGFAAATYLRGINFIQIPTTLLADVDSSVGGKTGIDHPGGKNLIGAFYQPEAVLIDTGFLDTLDDRDMANGFSEVIKYGAVLDGDFFNYLESNHKTILSRDKEGLSRIIERSCAIKAGVVNKDEKESGFRSVLNFGHSLGHAVETLYNYETLKHGEAVAIGMVFAAAVSKETGLCGEESVLRLKSLIENSGLPVNAPDFTPEQYINAMKLDKKVDDGLIKFVLMKDIGGFGFRALDFEFIRNFLKKYIEK